MKNRILYLTRNTIPYVKELHPIAGSVVGCILMQQLDYWFERFPDGFYKFLEPVDHEAYKPGESWTEELGITKDEFRTAFDRIGIRYVSKRQFEGAGDKFNGKFYCSYFNKQTYCTQYFRNHELLDSALDAMIFPDIKATPKSKKTTRESQSPVDRGSQSTVNQGIQSPVDRESQSRNICTEITLQILKTTTTAEITNSTDAGNEPGDCCVVDLTFPKAISDQEKIALTKILGGCDEAQEILDEIEGALANRSCNREKIVPFCASLRKAWVNGTFVPALGVAVAKRRRAEQLHTQALAMRIQVDPEVCRKGQALLGFVPVKKSREGGENAA